MSMKPRISLSNNRSWVEKIASKSLLDLISTQQFILIFAMNFLTIFFGVFIVGSEKTYGSGYIKNENLLSLVASIGGIFGACRFIWSIMLDKYSYKLIYGLLIGL